MTGLSTTWEDFHPSRLLDLEVRHKLTETGQVTAVWSSEAFRNERCGAERQIVDTPGLRSNTYGVNLGRDALGMISVKLVYLGFRTKEHCSSLISMEKVYPSAQSPDCFTSFSLIFLTDRQHQHASWFSRWIGQS